MLCTSDFVDNHVSGASGLFGGMSLPLQGLRCSVFNELLTPLLCAVGCVLSYTMAGPRLDESIVQRACGAGSM